VWHDFQLIYHTRFLTREEWQKLNSKCGQIIAYNLVFPHIHLSLGFLMLSPNCWPRILGISEKLSGSNVHQGALKMQETENARNGKRKEIRLLQQCWPAKLHYANETNNIILYYLFDLRPQRSIWREKQTCHRRVTCKPCITTSHTRFGVIKIVLTVIMWCSHLNVQGIVVA